MNDMPTAVISGASAGRPRSGRYATRSIAALTIANIDHDQTSVEEHPADDRRDGRRRCSSPSTLTITVLATSPESANTSPWAKLISCRIP